MLAAVSLVYSARHPRPLATRLRDVRLLTVDRSFPAAGRFANDPYIGPSACAECHPAQAALHSNSGHALTLRPASQRVLSRRLDGTSVADPEWPGVDWTYRVRDGHLYIGRRTSEKVEECIAEYAFGSGRHATTFVTLIDAAIPAILEHRLTHFTREGALGLTPGHDAKPPPPGLTLYGGVPPPRDTLKCFACHATQLSAHGDERIDVGTMLPNVSCERCHGPGRAHVAAARRNAPDSELSLPFGPDRWTAAELLRFCGECHRHPAGPRPDQIRQGDPTLARFQPIGLTMSKCYRESAGKLSCVNCHDPHAHASSNRSGYDAICLNCHGDRSGTTESLPMPIADGAACPVSPRARCVECHMPRVGVDLGQHVLLSDHWIRVHKADGSNTPK
jgi:hypothetical protein